MTFNKENVNKLYDSINENVNAYFPLAMRTAKDMGSEKMNLIHATFGISGEVDELSEPFVEKYNLAKDIENIEEEIGDIYWFVVLMLDTLNKRRDSFKIDLATLIEQGKNYASLNDMSIIGKIMKLNKSAGKITDIIKGHTVYGKELKEVELHNELVNLVFILNQLTYSVNSYLTKILVANVIKLAQRYPEKYSDELAAARLDKA